MLRAIGCFMGWALAAAVSLHGMQGAMSHCHTVMTDSNFTPYFGPFTQEKNYFCCRSEPFKLVSYAAESNEARDGYIAIHILYFVRYAASIFDAIT